jgi:hypothetical protein
VNGQFLYSFKIKTHVTPIADVLKKNSKSKYVLLCPSFYFENERQLTPPTMYSYIYLYIYSFVANGLKSN